MNQIDTGKFIASYRKEKGLTQAQLAEKLNITDRAVSKWETGKCMPDSSIMLELCNILDVTVNELLSGEKIEMNNYEENPQEKVLLTGIMQIHAIECPNPLCLSKTKEKKRKILRFFK